MKNLRDVQKHFQEQAEAQEPDFCWLENSVAFDLIESSPHKDAIEVLALMVHELGPLANIRLRMTTSHGILGLRDRYVQMATLLSPFK